MLAMRLATPGDRASLESMIRARADWMEARRLPNWRSWGRHIDELAGNCVRHHGTMWVLVEDGHRIVGCTTLLGTAAPWAWTAGEAAEAAFYLSATVTHPAERHRKLGTVIALWAVDRAAQTDTHYVRRDCTSPDLAQYYEKQKFRIVRKVSTTRVFTSYSMERKAERIPDLAGHFASGDGCHLTACNERSSAAEYARSGIADPRRLITRSILRTKGVQVTY
ncbi:GNAT family N-acetyltransferase [Streptomyces clavuligerus]|uniref:GNAT family N-acetyltransferase n=1 Tax=Streptomyces clavuligerus TaxID=1901 RepID=UPI00017FF62C|nr:GNAT family N-acetyltransferase [Streptomyces clavuligerus]EDY49223.1 hypothetical protein SSCG_02251 [Streptomyces clavuligerus]WDN56134.1 N-acetyltransferase [Streptomyces clavuligerus]